MERNWRLVAVFAGGAFILSVLSGAIAGVSFGALVLRAVLGALVFGGLSLGIQYVIDRFLPELKSTGSSADAASSAEEEAELSGRNVDIVVEEEPEELSSLGGSEGGDEAGEAAADGAEQSVAQGADAAAAQPYSFENLGEGQQSGEDRDSSGELIEEVEEVAAEEGGDTPHEHTPRHERASAEVTGEDIDQLPDVGGFADTFEDAPDDGAGAAGSEGGAFASEGLNSGSSSSEGRSDQDPETMARAIQTLLRRDE